MLTRIQLPEVDCKLFDHHFLERQGHKLLNDDDKQTSGMMTYPNLYYVDSYFFKKKIKFTDNKKSAEYFVSARVRTDGNNNGTEMLSTHPQRCRYLCK